MKNNSGEFYRCLNVNGFLHWSFFPNKLTLMTDCLKMDIELAHMLTQAHRLLGVLEGTVRNLPDIEPFLHMILLNEARNSCAFDGIMADMESILIFSKQTADGIMVKNYCDTLQKLKKEPFSLNVLCKIHKNIMKGELTSLSGEIRKEVFLMHPQYATNMEEYNPPPPDQLWGLMEDLRQFIQTNHSADVLVKAAISYYQFETIHPFVSGNGRVGRILILLILMQEGILSYPAFPMSAYLLEGKDECLRHFTNIQHFSNFSAWLRFFINGIAVSVENTICQLETAKELRKTNTHKIRIFGKPCGILLRLYAYIEKNPYISVNDVSREFGMAYNTAAKYIEILCEMGVLLKTEGQMRYRLFRFDGLLRLFQYVNN